MTLAQPPIAPGIDFHPVVAAWFRRHFDAPTDAQRAGWRHIRSRRDTLISAPTGSGKTLAAFLAGIDELVRKAEAGTLEDVTEIVYVSPLKALGNDIHRNLEQPLEEIRHIAVEMGYDLPVIRTAVRSGDTTQSERQAIVRRPPHILITTPEYSVLDLVGDTPLVRLDRVVPAGCAEVLGKLEARNPAGSVKDRIALRMIETAEREDRIHPGDTLVEPTSGNTGIGLAMVCARKGYGLVLTMPEDMSMERRRLLERFGATLHLTPAIEGMTGAVHAARQLVTEHGYFMPQQFDNPANPQVHRDTTGPEVLAATGGSLDAFVAGVGTGGTITGVGEVLREAGADARIVAVEPARSAVLRGGRAGLHGIQGIGASFVPSVLNREVYDEVMSVRDEDAYAMASRLTREEGLLVGISAGANVWASIEVGMRLGPGRRVVTMLCDTGERYLSVPIG